MSTAAVIVVEEVERRWRGTLTQTVAHFGAEGPLVREDHDQIEVALGFAKELLPSHAMIGRNGCHNHERFHEEVPRHTCILLNAAGKPKHRFAILPTIPAWPRGGECWGSSAGESGQWSGSRVQEFRYIRTHGSIRRSAFQSETFFAASASSADP